MKQSRYELVKGWKNYVSLHPGTKQRIEAIPNLPAYIGSTSHGIPELQLKVGDSSKTPVGTAGVKIELRDEGQNFHLIVFSPIDVEHSDLFFEFCYEILFGYADYSELEYCTDVTLEAYEKWKLLLATADSGISLQEWRGLLGELLTIRDLLTPIIGLNSSIESWVGPLGASHDFRFVGGVDVEVKTVGFSSTNINISSEFQLDSEFDLHILVWKIQAFSKEKILSFLKKLIREIKEILRLEVRPVFEIRLARYLTEISEATDIEVADITPTIYSLYQVSKDFPRLVPSTIPQGISSLNYKIDLGQMSKFEVPNPSSSSESTRSYLAERLLNAN